MRALELQTEFYELDGNSLSANVPQLKDRLHNGDFDLVLVIHYFGRTEPHLAEIAAASHKAGAILVEDLAHGFFSMHSGAQAGRYGSVNLFSLHKMFPTPNFSGGMVTYRDLSLLREQMSSRPELATFILDFDWFSISRARRKNFETLSRSLDALPENGSHFELMWPALDGNDVPQTLPVRIKNGRRDAIYHQMNEQGFGMVSLYHTLAHEVRSFRQSVDLSQSIINFPVHQDVQETELQPMADAFRRALVNES